MNRFFGYLKVQFMRAMKYYPMILIFTVILTASIVLFIKAMFQTKDGEEDKKRFEIGLVGDLSESYLDYGIVAFKNLDSSQYYVEFTEMEEDEAKERLLDGELYGYVIIPDGFIKSIIRGENKPLTYVASNSPATFGPILVNEIIQMVSQLVIQSQNGIYGLIDIAEQYDVSKKTYNKAIDNMNLEYISVVLNREGHYETTTVGLGNGLSYKDYYICAFLILLLLLWGIVCSALMTRHNMGLTRLLKSNGYSVGSMILGDYIPFLLLMCVNTGVLLLLGRSVFAVSGIEIFVRILPVVILLTAMQFFLYELSSNIITSVLMQLFVAVFLSYASGLFYPIYSLPLVIQECSRKLPVGLAFEYLSEILREKTGWEVLPRIWAYSFMFLGLSYLVRRYKIRSNRYE